jgi:hypothetical protein
MFVGCSRLWRVDNQVAYKLTRQCRRREEVEKWSGTVIGDPCEWVSEWVSRLRIHLRNRFMFHDVISPTHRRTDRQQLTSHQFTSRSTPLPSPISHLPSFPIMQEKRGWVQVRGRGSWEGTLARRSVNESGKRCTAVDRAVRYGTMCGLCAAA